VPFARLAAVLGLLVALAGCSDDPPAAESTATPTAAATTPSTASASPAASASPTASAGPTAGAPEPAPDAGATPDAAALAAFVTVVRSALPEVAAGRTDDEIAAVGTDACAGLADGHPADDVVAQAQSLGTLDAEATDPATARELVKLAIDRICLDQAGRVDEF
jgi:hypothetical protein